MLGKIMRILGYYLKTIQGKPFCFPFSKVRYLTAGLCSSFFVPGLHAHAGFRARILPMEILDFALKVKLTMFVFIIFFVRQI